MYHAVHHERSRLRHKERTDLTSLTEKCLGAFILAGTLDLSLDHLARDVGMSKRMLVHYFGGRDAIEERALTLLEDRLRAQFAPENFPSGVGIQVVIQALWEKTTSPESKGVLLLIMDLSRRAWNGSPRATLFYQEQQRLWSDLLRRYLPDRNTVEDILQSFQGAVLAFLITSNPGPGRSMLERLCAKLKPSEKLQKDKTNT